MNAVAARIYSQEPSRFELFEELQKELNTFPVGSEDDALFQRLFTDAQHLLEIGDMELSIMFQVSRPTINRWAAGRTAPHPLTRKAVMDQLAKVIGERKKVLSRNMLSRA
jgi:hypothetical protein